jgi:tRNA-dihydrouridine synthase A
MARMGKAIGVVYSPPRVAIASLRAAGWRSATAIYNAAMPASPAIARDALRLSVAPMMDWTDTHCRVFHRILAPHARLYTEMVHANAVIRGDRRKLLALDPVEHPVALQLGGSEPALLAQAARIGEEHGFDEINLNVGCPSDRVQAGRFGACLMREPALVADSVAAMIAGCSVPVTVKCRLGVDEDAHYDVFDAFIERVAAAGCRTFIVHARNAWLQGLSPKENRQVPPLRYDWAYRLKCEHPELDVIVNGGIATLDEATAHLAHADGAMLGRAAYHDPYLLHRLDAAWFAGPPYDGAVRSRAELLREFRPHVEAWLAQGIALKHVTRHVLGLFHGERGGRAFRQVLSEGAHKPGADWSLIESALAQTRSPAELAA